MTRHPPETGSASRSPHSDEVPRRSHRWKFWLGLAVTVLCIGYASRGIPLASLLEAMRGVNFWELLLLSAPFYVWSNYLRALRWKHLTDPVANLSRQDLYRATAVGFMVNNLLPLRIGEFVRSWMVHRETGAPLAAMIGTVALERVLDAVTVLCLALGALALVDRNSDLGGVLQRGSLLLLPLAIVPICALALMRLAPEWVVGISHWLLKPAGSRYQEIVESALRNFSQGLAALRGGRHLFWIALHSVIIWFVAATAPLLLGFWAFHINLGSFSETLLSAWILLGAVGVAVALPSAPGFIGPYQLAFKAVLERFGVDPATALAMGIVVWVIFWVSVTLQGAVALRYSPLRLAELLRRRP